MCGARDTWENGQGAAFRKVITEIDGCPSLSRLARAPARALSALVARLYRL